MDRIEEELRAGLARAVESPPTVPGLSEKIIHEGRRVRRRRLAVAGAAVAAVVVAAGVLLAPSLGRNRLAEPAIPSSGAPRVALTGQRNETVELAWPLSGQGFRRVFGGTPIAAVPAGVLLMRGGERPALLLQESPDAQPRAVVEGLRSTAVAVSPDGSRATVIVGVGTQRLLLEVRLPSAETLRSVSLGPPLVADGEPVEPSAYSGDAVMLTIGDGEDQHPARWEPGDEQIIGPLQNQGAVIGGGRVGALAMTDATGTCTEIGTMGASFNAWALCDEDFIGFSPDGGSALALTLDGRSVVVHDTGDGDRQRALTLPEPARAVGWEADDTVLYSAVRDGRTIVVRCVVSSGDCRTAETLADSALIPVPLPTYGALP